MKILFKKNYDGVLIAFLENSKKGKNLLVFDKKLKDEISKKLKVMKLDILENENILLEVFGKNVLVYGIKKDYSNEDLRCYSSNIFNILKNKKLFNCSIFNVKKENIIPIFEGFDLTDYDFDKYKSLKKDEKVKKEFSLNFLENSDKKVIDEVNRVKIINQNVKNCRDMVNDNSNVITPKYFEKISKDFVKKHKLKVEILNDLDLQKKGLNLFYAVGEGSVNKPKLIILKYEVFKGKPFEALVGKGVCFDTGGLNLKPTGAIEDMRIDMAGAGVCFNTFKSLVELKVKKNLLCALCVCENSISSKSYKPCDVFKSYKGDFVEITNTDAEGRLILADGISYIQKNYKVDSIIDVATLTGACMVALGLTTIGLFTNNENMKNNLIKSSKNTDEDVWHLPINEEHKNVLKSKISDLSNCGMGANRRYGGASSAAAFLLNFIDKKTNWTHLDIAGPTTNQNFKKGYVSNNATGIGVRLLCDYFLKK